VTAFTDAQIRTYRKKLYDYPKQLSKLLYLERQGFSWAVETGEFGLSTLPGFNGDDKTTGGPLPSGRAEWQYARFDEEMGKIRRDVLPVRIALEVMHEDMRKILDLRYFQRRTRGMILEEMVISVPTYYKYLQSAETFVFEQLQFAECADKVNVLQKASA
jgi:hypothetical protein